MTAPYFTALNRLRKSLRSVFGDASPRCPTCGDTSVETLSPRHGGRCQNCQDNTDHERGDCPLCGKHDVPLEDHHTFGRDRDPDTIEPVCRNCHHTIHFCANFPLLLRPERSVNLDYFARTAGIDPDDLRDRLCKLLVNPNDQTIEMPTSHRCFVERFERKPEQPRERNEYLREHFPFRRTGTDRFLLLNLATVEGRPVVRSEYRSITPKGKNVAFYQVEEKGETVESVLMGIGKPVVRYHDLDDADRRKDFLDDVLKPHLGKSVRLICPSARKILWPFRDDFDASGFRLLDGDRGLEFRRVTKPELVSHPYIRRNDYWRSDWEPLYWFPKPIEILSNLYCTPQSKDELDQQAACLWMNVLAESLHKTRNPKKWMGGDSDGAFTRQYLKWGRSARA